MMITAPATTRLVGRDGERAALLERLTPGLLSITGPAGVGKSALLRATLHDVNGAWRWLRLRETHLDHDALERALAQAAGPGWAQDQTLKIIAIDCGSATPATLIKALPSWIERAGGRICWAITTRSELRLRAERVFALDALALTPTHATTLSDAAQLLSELATERGAALPEDAHTQLEALAAELGGIPLAIELAAWRVRFVGLDELLKLLREDLSVLEQQLIDMTTRHRSYPHLLAQQWEQLEDQERRALLRCAAFNGPFSIEAASRALECSMSMAIQLLEALVKRSAFKLQQDHQHLNAKPRLVWWAIAQREVLRQNPDHPETARARALLQEHARSSARAATHEPHPRDTPSSSELLDALAMLDAQQPQDLEDAALMLELLSWRGISWEEVPRYEAQLRRLAHLNAGAPSPKLDVMLGLDRPWLDAEALRARQTHDPYQALPSLAMMQRLPEDLRDELYALEALRRGDAQRGLALLAKHQPQTRTRQARHQWLRGMLLAKSGELDQARGSLEGALAGLMQRTMTPQRHQLQLTLAKLALWRGDTQAATSQLQALAGDSPADAEVAALLALAGILTSAGQWSRGPERALMGSMAVGHRPADERWWQTLNPTQDQQLITLAKTLAMTLAAPTPQITPETTAQHMALIVQIAISSQRYQLDTPLDLVERAGQRWRAMPAPVAPDDILERVLSLTLDALQHQQHLHTLAGALQGQRQRVSIDMVEDHFRIADALPVPFGHRPKIRRLIEVLLIAQRDHIPSLSAHEVIEQVWVGERLSYDSALARLYNLVASLRQLGWRELLVHDNEGYTLSDQFIITVRWP